jgi:hypothetical protein
MFVMGFLVKRIFGLFDKLMEEDKKLHTRITNVATETPSRSELIEATDKLLTRMDRMEERLILKQ